MPTDVDMWQSEFPALINNMTESQVIDKGFKSFSQIKTMSQSNPNGYWYLFGEPNRYSGMSGEKFAHVFRYYEKGLKAGNSHVKIIGPSLLNWDYTCIGCSGTYLCDGKVTKGYQCGKVWFRDFIDTYETFYGKRPEVYAWAIDVYPLDWVNTPNSIMHADIAIAQIIEMREYLSDIPEYTETPIWITELGLHIGYDGYGINSSSELYPIGSYHWDKMGNYLVKVVDWLDANSTPYNIEKWFFFATYKNIIQVEQDGYMGITLFDAPEISTPINCLGATYKSRVLKTQKSNCDSSGNVILE